MTFKFDQQFIGYPPIENVVPVPASLAALEGTSGISPGFMATAEDPVWGPGEFIFGRAGGSIPLASACVLQTVWDAVNLTIQQNMVVAPNTANNSQSLYAYMGNTALTVGQYGWFMMAGNYPVASNASVAAQTVVGIAAAGQLGATSAGKQVQGAISAIPATQTVTTNIIGGYFSQNGGTTVQVQNPAGFFPGVYVSGTGIAAGAFVTAIDYNKKVLTLSAANTAAPSGVLTATYNNGTIFYNVIQMNCPQMQGRIT